MHGLQQTVGGPGSSTFTRLRAGWKSFFLELDKYNGGPPIQEVLSFDEFCLREHEMEVKGPGPGGEKSWRVEAGRIVHD